MASTCPYAVRFDMSDRKAFNFYRSFYDCYKMLKTDKEKANFITAILERQFEGKEPTDLKGMAEFAYNTQKQVIDQQIRGWEDKTGKKLDSVDNQIDQPLSKGGAEGGQSTPTEQEKEKEQEKGKDKGGVKPEWSEFLSYSKTQEPKINEAHLRAKFDQWVEDGWKDGNGKPIKNWKTKIRNTIPFLKKDENKDEPLRASTPTPPPSYLMED